MCDAVWHQMVATPVVLQGVSDDDTSWTPTDNDSDIHSVSSYDPIDGEEEGGPGHDEEEGGPAHVTKASMKHTIENGPAVIEQKHTIGCLSNSLRLWCLQVLTMRIQLPQLMCWLPCRDLMAKMLTFSLLEL